MFSPAETQYAQHPEAHGPSVPELLSRLATQSNHLVRDEIALVKEEIREKAVILRSGLLFAVVAALLGVPALLALFGALAAALMPVMGAWQALLVVGGGLVLISAVFAGISAGILRRVTLKPEQTLDTLEENKEWLKELT